MKIQKTAQFLSWLKTLRDQRGRARIALRIDRFALGNPGDIRPVGEGVSEMRIDVGPGYRIYFVLKDEEVVLLWGGDKSTQKTDIVRAKRIAEEIDHGH
jgi:putative addiction module killer protein